MWRFPRLWLPVVILVDITTQPTTIARIFEPTRRHVKQVCIVHLSDGIHVLEASHTTPIHCLEEDKVWSTISSLVVWVLWKARCKGVFQKVKPNAVELVKEIWLMLMHTLKRSIWDITWWAWCCVSQATTILINSKKGRGLHLFWGQNKVEICSNKMAFSGPFLQRTMHDDFRY